jgi:membrane protease YdiL (CAAX protease family)
MTDIASDQPIPGSQSRKDLARLTYAAVFLVVTSVCFVHSRAAYENHLVQTKQYSSVMATAQYSAFIDSLFLLMQLAVLLLFFRPLPTVFASRSSENPTNRPVIARIGLGFLAGLVTFLAGASFVGGPQSSTLGTFVANHLFSVSAVVLVVLVVVLLPLASEIFFRGIFFRQLLESMPLAPALILSTALFTWAWPMFNSIAALALGLLSGVLFYRTRSVLACIVANATATIALGVFVTCRALLLV